MGPSPRYKGWREGDGRRDSRLTRSPARDSHLPRRSKGTDPLFGYLLESEGRG